MKYVEHYHGYSIFDSCQGYLLIGEKDNPDFIQQPFINIEAARKHIDLIGDKDDTSNTIAHPSVPCLTAQ